MAISRRTSLLAAAACIAALLGWTPAASGQERMRVVASFSILGDLVREIGGEYVDVATLVGPDGDAHVYEPTPADARALARAGLLVVNGLDFEGWLPRLVKSSGFSGRQVVASEGIVPLAWSEPGGGHEGHAGHGHHGGHDHDHDHDHGHDHDHAAGTDGHRHGELDPHAWQSLANGVIYVRNITQALEAADPGHAAYYRQRAGKYTARLQALDTRIKAEFAAIPAQRRKVVTSHDAFQYFGKAYGVEFVAPEGISTEAEASAGDVARIVDQIRAENLAAVFVENITDRRLIEQITRETGARVGGELYSDALSGPDGPAATYEQMFRHNASQLVGAMRER